MAKTKTPGIGELIKKSYESVGLLHTLLDVITGTALGLTALIITNSFSLRVIIAAGAVAGALLGYFVSVWLWRGRAKSRRKKYAISLICAAVFGGFLTVGTIAILDPEVAEMAEALIQMREIMLRGMLVTNLLICLLSCVTAFSVTASITVISPHMVAH